MTTFRVYLKNGDIITMLAKDPEEIRQKLGAGTILKIKRVKGA